MTAPIGAAVPVKIGHQALVDHLGDIQGAIWREVEADDVGQPGRVLRGFFTRERHARLPRHRPGTGHP